MITNRVVTDVITCGSEPQPAITQVGRCTQSTLFEQGELPEVLPLSAKAFPANTHADRKRATGRFKIAPADINTLPAGYSKAHTQATNLCIIMVHRCGCLIYIKTKVSTAHIQSEAIPRCFRLLIQPEYGVLNIDPIDILAMDFLAIVSQIDRVNILYRKLARIININRQLMSANIEHRSNDPFAFSRTLPAELPQACFDNGFFNIPRVVLALGHRNGVIESLALALWFCRHSGIGLPRQ